LVVALVEDDESLRIALTRVLQNARLDVHPFGSAEALLASTGRYACLVLDIQLPGISGLQLADQLRTEGDRTPIVFLTGGGDDLVRDVKRRTGQACLTKPVDEATLLIAIATAALKG
jgi:FixJ family two-component response regulator